MNKLRFLLLSLFVVTSIFSSCKKDNKGPKILDSTKEYNLKDEKYGSHKDQTLDLYLPANRNAEATKVFILIHGGGWSGGDKKDLKELYNNLKELYPNTAIANINYRLASPSDPAFPKQIDDIKKVIQYLKEGDYNIANKYCFFGISAGAHLSLLYGYGYDSNHEVEAICNTVGPTDLTDPEIENYILSQELIKNLIGTKTMNTEQELLEAVSPVYHITSNSPATISFYGGNDILIPVSQMNILHDKLDAEGVYNEKTLYPEDGHADWSQANTIDYATKLINFIENKFIP